MRGAPGWRAAAMLTTYAAAAADGERVVARELRRAPC